MKQNWFYFKHFSCDYVVALQNHKQIEKMERQFFGQNYKHFQATYVKKKQYFFVKNWRKIELLTKIEMVFFEKFFQCLFFPKYRLASELLGCKT